MEKEKEKWNWKKALIIFGVIACIVLLVVMVKPQPAGVSQACCEKICDSAGRNMDCYSMYNKEVTCSFNYAQYENPHISELFKFKIENVDAICGETDDGKEEE